MTKFKVIIPVGLKPFPARYEVSAADLLADYFKADIEFIPRTNQKTPDFTIDGIIWELKSPTGKGRNNIERQLQTGLKSNVCYNVHIEGSAALDYAGSEPSFFWIVI